LTPPLRVALFGDSYHELNGVGTVSREFAAFAGREGLPFCRVHAGPVTRVDRTGSVTSIELKRCLRIPLNKDLFFDPFLSRYRNRVFEDLYRTYAVALHTPEVRARISMGPHGAAIR
jgi:hypothetical protein